MKSFLRYAGGKTKLIPYLLPYIENILIGEKSFADCFVGGGSILLAIASKYKDIELFCNDKDPQIYTLWKTLSSTNKSNIEDLCEKLNKEPTIDYFYELRNSKPTSDVDLAYRTIFFNRTCFSGIIKPNSSPIGGKHQKSKWTVNCRYNSKKLQQQVIEVNKLIAGRVVVENKDVLDFISNKSCPLYLDPPYVKAGKELYLEYMTLEEHEKLANVLTNKVNWVLSYDDHDKIRELYKNYKIIDLSARYSVHGSKVKWSNKNELIILG